MILNTTEKILKMLPEIGVDAYAVYHVLAMHMDIGTRKCFPSKKLLMDATGLSKDRLYAAIRKLLDAGLVSAEQQKSTDGKFNKIVYTLHDGVSIYLPDNQVDSPCAGKPGYGFPEPGFPYPGFPDNNNYYIEQLHTQAEPVAGNHSKISNSSSSVKPKVKEDREKMAVRECARALDESRSSAGLPGMAWTEKELGNLRRILVALKSMAGKDVAWDFITQEKYFRRYCEICMADEWMADKLVPAIMYSQYNNVMTKYHAQKKKAKTETIPPYLRKLQR